MEEINVFRKRIVFNDNDFGDFGILPSSLLAIFQDIAIEHSIILGISSKTMLEKNLFWVTMRTKFQIIKQPQKGEELELVTYPSSKNMLEYDRDYLIINNAGETLVKATSKWCLVSTKTRQPVMRVKDEPFLPVSNLEPLFEGRFYKTEMFVPKFLPDLSYIISPQDIDENWHTSNVVYAKIIEKLLTCEKRKITFFQINYLKETLASQRLDLFRQDNENELNILGKICEGENSFSSLIKFL